MLSPSLLSGSPSFPFLSPSVATFPHVSLCFYSPSSPCFPLFFPHCFLFLLSPSSPPFPPLFFSFSLCSAGAVVMENGSGCWTKMMMSWRWRWQCWYGSLPSFILSSVVPLWFSLSFPLLFFFSFSSLLFLPPPPPPCPSVSPAFRGQRPCAGNGQLDNVCRGMTAVTYAP